MVLPGGVLQHIGTHWLEGGIVGNEQRVATLIEPYVRRPHELIQALHRVQEVRGYISEEAQEIVAESLGVSIARVYGVVTFYHHFRTRPVGKHIIRLCLGTACHVRGGERVLKTLQDNLDVGVGNTSTDGMFTLEVVRCLGTCSLAPVMMVDETVHGRLNTENVQEVIQSYYLDNGS